MSRIACLQRDVPRQIDLYLRGSLKLDELITARYPLERINDALAVDGAGGAERDRAVAPAARRPFRRRRVFAPRSQG